MSICQVQRVKLVVALMGGSLEIFGVTIFGRIQNLGKWNSMDFRCTTPKGPYHLESLCLYAIRIFCVADLALVAVNHLDVDIRLRRSAIVAVNDVHDFLVRGINIIHLMRLYITIPARVIGLLAAADTSPGRMRLKVHVTGHLVSTALYAATWT